MPAISHALRTAALELALAILDMDVVMAAFCFHGSGEIVDSIFVGARGCAGGDPPGFNLSRGDVTYFPVVFLRKLQTPFPISTIDTFPIQW